MRTSVQVRTESNEKGEFRQWTVDLFSPFSPGPGHIMHLSKEKWAVIRVEWIRVFGGGPKEGVEPIVYVAKV